MLSLDSYNRGHNALALHNCNKLAVRDPFLVPFHLDLVHTLEFQCAHPSILIEGSHFGLNSVGSSPIHHQFITPTGMLIMAY